jgi:2-polyprenyl-3-methyl-5-hydroxy-6-metoxy-1,4-benzoquinol methylase
MTQYIDEEKIRKLRELEFERTKSHTQVMYDRPSHLARKKTIEEMIIACKADCLDGKALDYGCAEGLYCEYLLSEGFRNVYGVDISMLKIEEARKKYASKGIRFFAVDEFNRMNNIGKFKLILCLEVLQHVNNYRKLLAELKDIMEDDGYLLVSIPNLSKNNEHEYANINNEMTVEQLLHEVGGAGFGKQNAIWKFNSKLFYDDIGDEFKVINIRNVDTPDGAKKNLWTVGLLTKNK